MKRMEKKQDRASKKSRRFKIGRNIGILLLSMGVLLTGCSGISDMVAVYDNEARIASQSNSYNKVNYRQSEKNNTITVVCETFEGMDTLWDYDAEGTESFDFAYDLKSESGKAKLVLIRPDGSLETLVEVTDKTEGRKAEGAMTLEMEAGRNRIKLVGGEDTQIDLEMTMTKLQGII